LYDGTLEILHSVIHAFEVNVINPKQTYRLAIGLCENAAMIS